ncbi:MAG: DUF1501 domain-containing protein [Steroidobacteraceae bacterium]
MNINRRTFLGHGLAGAALAASGGLAVSRISLAAPAAGESRFVFVILRGALDGLTAVPPLGDPHYAALRGALALPTSAAAAAPLRLDDLFALHPALQELGQLWQQRQLAVLPAVATPYRERSHFDAQDVLETGLARPQASRSGWLNRALAALPPTGAAQGGVAVGAGIPLVMRGKVEVASWSPKRLPDLDADTLARIVDLYAEDPLLSVRIADALAADAMAGGAMQPAGGGPGAQLAEAARAAARFLAQPVGPRVAVLETTGWDTHANQGAEQGLLALRLAALDAMLKQLRESLDTAWPHTMVLAATEFGRTVAVNGTRGTDHGTGAAAFLLGGAVRGGRVIGDWPGLGPAALRDGRDLAPTMDLRAVFKSVLRDHLGVPQPYLESEVFPDSRAAGYIDIRV